MASSFPLYLLLLGGWVSLSFAAATQHRYGNASVCHCFMTNGSEKAFFTNHLFYDFRDLPQFSGVPPVIRDINGSTQASATSNFFVSDAWNKDWTIQSWNNNDTIGKPGVDAKILLVNSPNNVYIQANNDVKPASKTYMTLRTKRFPTFQSAAEIESVSTAYRFVSLRMLARTIGSPGACTAMFTYRTAEELTNIQEADLEVRTMDPRNKIQYTNQPSYTVDGKDITEATRNASMPGNLQWSDWAVHRMDWTPDRSTWYVDGQQVASITFQAPKDASRVIFNSWSDGGSWSGAMAMYDEAYLQIQWVEMVYNTTDEAVKRSDGSSGDIDARGWEGMLGQIFQGVGNASWEGIAGRLFRREVNRGCEIVCSIDETNLTGTPVIVENAAPGRLFAQIGVLAWIPGTLTGGIAISYLLAL
jgi:beta-glucanase (GH16 family)